MYFRSPQRHIIFRQTPFLRLPHLLRQSAMLHFLRALLWLPWLRLGAWRCCRAQRQNLTGCKHFQLRPHLQAESCQNCRACCQTAQPLFWAQIDNEKVEQLLAKTGDVSIFSLDHATSRMAVVPPPHQLSPRDRKQHGTILQSLSQAKCKTFAIKKAKFEDGHWCS